MCTKGVFLFLVFLTLWHLGPDWETLPIPEPENDSPQGLAFQRQAQPPRACTRTTSSPAHRIPPPPSPRAGTDS